MSAVQVDVFTRGNKPMPAFASEVAIAAIRHSNPLWADVYHVQAAQRAVSDMVLTQCLELQRLRAEIASVWMAAKEVESSMTTFARSDLESQPPSAQASRLSTPFPLGIPAPIHPAGEIQSGPPTFVRHPYILPMFRDSILEQPYAGGAPEAALAGGAFPPLFYVGS